MGDSMQEFDVRDKMLEVRGLSKYFDDLLAVDNFSFEIREGEVVGLVGPNGCGKTTTLNCITSILDSDEGEIIMLGHNLYEEPAKAKKDIAFIPEMPELLFYQLTVLENIQLISKAYFHDDWEKTAEKLIKAFDLEDKANDPVGSLSKGQKQKTAIIAAFAHEPRLLIFDEPLIGIDPKGGKVLKDLIDDHRKDGGSVLISSHMLDLIEEISDKVIIMGNGKKLAEGTMEEIRTRAFDDSDSDDKDLEAIYIKITEGEDPNEDGEFLPPPHEHQMSYPHIPLADDGTVQDGNTKGSRRSMEFEDDINEELDYQ